MNNPNKLLSVPFADDGFKNSIQTQRQVGQDEGDATWADGFPNITMLPIDMGGLPPKGLDFNGIFHAISANTVFLSKGGYYKFDAAYAEKIGGYSIGAIVMNADVSIQYVSIVDGNKNDPNINTVGWRPFGGYGTVKNASTEQTGIVQLGHTAAGLSVQEQEARAASVWWVGQLQLKVDRAVPAGAIMHFAGQNAPNGWLKANDAAVSRTVYKDLFDAIGTTYGLGDKVKTFNLPDLRGEFLRGVDDGRNVDTGRVLGSSQGHAIEKHNHYMPTGSGIGNASFKPYAIPDTIFEKTQVNIAATTGTENTTYPNKDYGNPDYVGNVGKFASETRPRNVALLACIKY